MIKLALLAFALTLLPQLSCSTFDRDTAEPDLRVVAPYLDEEATHFQEVLSNFEHETGLKVDFLGSGDLAATIQRAISDGIQMDVALLAQPGLIDQFVRTETIVPLTDSVISTINDHYDEQSAALGIVDDEYYGVWFRADIKSIVWYSPSVFEANGWEIPSTLSELEELTTSIAEAGLAPWCMTLGAFGATGWPATDWIEDLVLRLSGTDVYDQWTHGEIGFASPSVLSAFQEFQSLLNPSNIYGGRPRALGAQFRQSPLDLAAGHCAMLRFGTVAQDLFPSGTTFGEDKDINIFLLPGEEAGLPPILVSGEIAVAFNDRPETSQLLAYLATPESGEVWAQQEGYLPPHRDFDPSKIQDGSDSNFAEVLQEATFRFDGSDLMPPEIGTDLFWKAMIDIVAGKDLVVTLCGLDNAWAELRTPIGETPQLPDGESPCKGQLDTTNDSS